MTLEDRHILDEFASRVRDRYPGSQIWAFGSRARGDADWESDLDVCIVLDHVPGYEERQWIGERAWEVGFAHDRIITTTIHERAQFESGPLSASPLVKNILREGIPA